MNHPQSNNGKVDSAINSPICVCNGLKLEGKPFCCVCYKILRDETKLTYDLNLESGNKFYEAYENCVEYLREEGKI